MTKRISLMLGCTLLLWAVSCKPVEEPKPEPVAPQPQFQINDAAAEDVYNIDADQTMKFMAEISNTDVYGCAWYLDDEKIANTLAVTYTFEDPGSYQLRFHAGNEKGEAERTFTVNVAGIPMDVEYSPDGDLEARIKEAINVSVKVLAGDKNTKHSWTVGGKIVSEEAQASVSFDTPGSYVLNWFGINKDKMTASKQWNIVVRDLDLAASYTPAEEALTTVAGASLKFTANVTAGVFGLSHKWMVGEETVGNAAEMNHTFAEAGTYTVQHIATNAQEDQLVHSWTVTVEPAPEPDPEPQETGFVYDDFEGHDIGIISYFSGNKVGGKSILEIVENPYKTASNNSSKVFVDRGSLMTNNSSGYFTFKINAHPDGTPITSEERAKYTRFRVKVYLGDSGFTPLLQEDAKSSRSAPVSINGQPFNPETGTEAEFNALIKKNDWNVLVYDLSSPKYSSEVNNFAQAEQLQFRVFVDLKNNGKAGKDIYFDDMEFLEPEGSQPEPEPEPEPQETGFVYDDFEGHDIGIISYFSGNKVGGKSILEIVENPYKTASNSSSKVFVDRGSLMTNNSSGYFTFKINAHPDGTPITSEERAKYTRFRVKVYLGDSGFTPLLQEDAKNSRSAPVSINGQPFNPETGTEAEFNALIKKNDWNVLVYDLSSPKYSSEVNNFAQTEQLQFRVFVDLKNNGKAGKDIYFDDMVFEE